MRRWPTWWRVVAVFGIAAMVVAGIPGIWLLRHASPQWTGSRPPDGQQLPNLAAVRGLEPAFPKSRAAGELALGLVVTCFECRSGDVVGGFVPRIQDDLPRGVRLRVVGWGGSARAWRAEHRIAQRVSVHAAATPAAQRELLRLLHVGESGQVLVFNTRGRWVSTFHLGQLDREDVLDDLAAAADGRAREG